MKPPRVLEFKDLGLSIEIYGGYGEIGGNCVVVRDRDRKIILDNGVRFSVVRRFYGGGVEPLGPLELEALGAVPPASIYSDSQALYITHYHLDHLGLLGRLGGELVVRVPSREILALRTDRYSMSPSWLAYVPPHSSLRVEDTPLLKEDRLGVIGVPVSHSSYPSYAYLYIGDKATIFYSGDLRLEPVAGLWQEGFEEVWERLGVGGVDIAIVEGTNFGRDYLPISPAALRDSLYMLVRSSETLYIFLDPLDLEALAAVIQISSLAGVEASVASEELSKAVEILRRIYPSMRVGEAPLEDLGGSEGVVILSNPQDFVEELRRKSLWGAGPDLRGSTAVFLDPEPGDEIGIAEERSLREWLTSMGIQVLRLRPSGHYYPIQFRRLLEILKPKRLIPIHTTSPDAMLALFEKYRG